METPCDYEIGAMVRVNRITRQIDQVHIRAHSDDETLIVIEALRPLLGTQAGGSEIEAESVAEVEVKPSRFGRICQSLRKMSGSFLRRKRYG